MLVRVIRTLKEGCAHCHGFEALPQAARVLAAGSRLQSQPAAFNARQPLTLAVSRSSDGLNEVGH